MITLKTSKCLVWGHNGLEAITDLLMPNMTGDKLIEEIRLISPDLPIIVTTGRVTNLIDENLLNDLAIHVLKKPVGSEDVVQALVGFLGEGAKYPDKRSSRRSTISHL